ncbi:MAG: TonB-dependent receptor [Aquincola sp.]|nr:TonB-dependent receptor [Aquincola sp.]
MRIKSVVAAALSMGVTALAGQSAYAQGSEADSIGLEEVVVTARKREESLQDVPLAVTALSAEQISDRQVQSIDDLARFTPGLVFAKAFGRSNDRPVIRGLASVLAGTNGTVETGAAYFVDGIYYPGDITSLDMADVARVEVIRGPQSALYGRNTYSGAVNFITRSPGDSFDGAASANFDKDEVGANLRLSGPLGEKAGGGVSMRYNKFDGQWVNQLTGKTIGSEESKSISGVLELTPTDDVTLRFRATWGEDRDGSRPLFFQSAGDNDCYPGLRSLASYNSTSTTNNNQYFCGEIQPGIIALNDAPVTGRFRWSRHSDDTEHGSNACHGRVYDTRQGLVFSGVERDLAIASAIGTWDIFGSGYTLTVDGGAREDKRKTGSDSDHSSVNIIQAPINGVQRQALGAATAIDETRDYSAEIKINSPEDARFRWLLGAYHYDQELRTFDMDFTTPNGQSEPWQIIDVTNTSFFGSIDYDFTDRLSASVELRSAKEYKQLNQRANRPNFQTPGATTFNGKDSWKATTPRVTVDFKLTPDITLFANFAKGTKPGGFNGATASNNGRPQDITFDEETSKNYEIGMKSAWMDNRLIANVSAFYLEATDIQLTTPIQSITTGAVTSIATNQGSGEIRGLELEARFAATENLTLGLTYALADTEFTEGCDDFQYTLTSGGGVYRSSAPATSFNPTGLGDCSIAGNPFRSRPRTRRASRPTTPARSAMAA